MMGEMTKSEIELSKKLLNAQELASKAADLTLIQARQLDLLKDRIDKLEAFCAALCIARQAGKA